MKVEKELAPHLNYQERKHLLIIQERIAFLDKELGRLRDQSQPYAQELDEFYALRFASEYIQTITNDRSLHLQNKKQRTRNRRLKRQLQREKERNRFI